MFRKNPYKEVAKHMRQEIDQEDLKIQDFQIVSPIRSKYDESLEAREFNSSSLESQSYHIDVPERMQDCSFLNAMAKNNNQCKVGEINKLFRIQNYNV